MGCFCSIIDWSLSKAFDCIRHDLIITKLAAHGFGTNFLKLIHNYLYNTKQRVRVNSAYSVRKDIYYGFPQGSLLWLLLLNMRFYDLFYFLENTDIAIYADDNLYSAEKNKEAVINGI